MYSVTINFGAGPIDVTQYLVGQYPIKRSRSLHNDFKFVIGTCEFAINRCPEIVNWFLLESAEQTVVITKDNAPYFSGIIRRTVQVSIGQMRIDALKIQCVDPLYRLDKKKIRTAITWANYKISNPSNKSQSILHQLFYLAGFADSELNFSLIDVTIDRYVVDGTDKPVLIRSLIERVLFETVFTLRVTASGIIELFDLYPAQTNAAYTLATGSGGCIAEHYSVKRDENKVEAVDITYWPHETLQNAVVFEDTTGATAALACSIPVLPGQYYPDGADANTPIRCKYELKDYELIAVDNPTLIWEHTGNVTLQIAQADNLGMMLRFYSQTGGVITKLRIVGNAIVKGDKNKISVENVASSDAREDLSCELVTDKTNAERLAKGRAAWYKNAAFIYELPRVAIAQLPATINIGDIFYLHDYAILGADQKLRIIRIDDGNDPKTISVIAEGIDNYSAISIAAPPIVANPQKPPSLNLVQDIVQTTEDQILSQIDAEIQQVRNGDLVDGAISRAKLAAGFLEEHDAAVNELYPFGINQIPKLNLIETGQYELSALVDWLNRDRIEQDANIVLSEEKIKLAIQKITEAETNIAALEINFDSISTTVASYSDHGTRISQVEQTVSEINSILSELEVGGEIINLSLITQNADRIASIVANGGYTDDNNVFHPTKAYTEVTQLKDRYQILISGQSSDDVAALAGWVATKDELQSFVTHTELDTELGAIEADISLIQQTANQIQLLVADAQYFANEGDRLTQEKILTLLDQGVIENASSIVMTEQKIALVVQKQDEKNTYFESSLTIQANEIASQVARLDNGIATNASQITQLSNQITAEVSSRQSADSSIWAQVNIQAGQISSIVGDISTINGTLTNVNSQISQLSTQISYRVQAKSYNPSTDTWSDTQAFMALRVALPETMSLDRKNAIYSLLSPSEKTVFDRIYELYQVQWYGGSEYRYKITANPTPDDLNSMTATFTAKGLLSSQFLVDAEELFLKGTIRAEYLDIDTISAFVINAVQANIDNLAAKKLTIDTDPNANTDFETYIDKDNGILAKANNQIIFQAAPNGSAYFKGAIDASMLNVSGSINAGVFATQDFNIPQQTISTPTATHWYVGSLLDALSSLAVGEYSCSGTWQGWPVYKIKKDSSYQVTVYYLVLYVPGSIVFSNTAQTRFYTSRLTLSIPSGPSFDSNNYIQFYSIASLIDAFINKVPVRVWTSVSGSFGPYGVSSVYVDPGNKIILAGITKYASDYSNWSVSVTIPAQSSQRWLIGTDAIGRYEFWPHNIPGSNDEIVTVRNTDPNDVFSILEIRSPDKNSGATEATLALHAVNGGGDFVNDKALHNYSGVMKVLDVFSNFGGYLPTEARWEWVKNDSGGEISLMHLYAKNGGIWAKGGRTPTGTFHRNASFILGDLYNALAPAIPNVGDKILLHGGIRGSIVAVCSYAERISSSGIMLYTVQDNLADTITVNYGSSATYAGISLAW